MPDRWHVAVRIRRLQREAYAQWVDLLPIQEEYQLVSLMCDMPVEITSGAIIPSDSIDAFLIEANTSGGLRKFFGREVSVGDPQSDPRTAQLATKLLTWSTAATTIIYLSGHGSFGTEASWPALPTEEHSPIAIEAPAPTAGEVLAKLSSASGFRDTIRQSILDAEIITFDAQQITVLKPLLRQYIEQNRDSSDPSTLVAVASAIRKYVGILARDEISSIGFILEANHKLPVPAELELEVTKMVVRKLRVVLPREPNSLPELGRQLMDLARTYLNTRLLPRQHYGAIALNSVLALTLLRVPGLEELVALMRQLPLSWFKQLVVQRAESLKDEISHQIPETEANSYRHSLDALIHGVQQGPGQHFLP